MNSLGTISSISEDSFKIYFATNNGFFSYDKLDETIVYEYDLSKSISNPDIKLLMYDRFRDYFWIVNRGKLLFKSSLGIYWRESEIDIDFIVNFRIGCNEEYVIINDSFNYIYIDPYNGNEVDLNRTDRMLTESRNNENIIWSSFLDTHPIDISEYIPPENWDVKNLKLFNYDSSKEISITSYYIDTNNDKWFGTDNNLIIKVPSFSYRMEFIRSGPKNPVSTISHFYDGNYIFADNSFIRTGRFGRNTIGENVFSIFNLYENSWEYIDVNYGDFGSTDINDVLVQNNKIYASTMNGISIYDLLDEERKFLSIGSGLYDNAIWEIEKYNNIIYAATSKGINEVSIILDDVIKTNNKAVKAFDGIEVYDIIFKENIMYASCINGIYKIDILNEEVVQVTDKALRRIEIFENSIIGNDRNLWIINLANGKERKIATNIVNFSLFENHIWINKKNKAVLYSINSDEQVEYNPNVLPGSKIYNVIADSSNVIFLTDNGIGLYNWDAYNE